MTKDIATVKAALESAQKRGDKVRNALDFIRYGDKSKTIDGQALADAGNNLSAMRSYIKDATDCIETALSSPPAAPTPDNNGHDEFVMVRKSDLCKAAACLMLPDNGVTDTVWFANGCTLFEHLVGLAGIDDLTADVDADYARLSGKPLPPPPALDKGE